MIFRLLLCHHCGCVLLLMSRGVMEWVCLSFLNVRLSRVDFSWVKVMFIGRVWVPCLLCTLIKVCLIVLWSFLLNQSTMRRRWLFTFTWSFWLYRYAFSLFRFIFFNWCRSTSCKRLVQNRCLFSISFCCILLNF